MPRIIAILSLSLLPSPILVAQNSETSFSTTKTRETIQILGSSQNADQQPGSAHVLSEEDLEKFKFTDLNQILKQIPGVSIQEEDGFGLRPNIGLRGAHPHRSRKVAFLEDGVLVGPAPYSAPAAYYVPIPTRFHAVEVFKGPSSVKYGPNTIGGVINFVTRPVGELEQTFIDLSGGSFDFYKAHLGSYDRKGIWSWGIEGSKIGSRGFKKLPDKDQSTGFEKDDLLLKLAVDLSPSQRLALKWGWSEEVSNETYLGLTLTDFNQDPYERYLASESDRMTWKHRQFQMTHFWDRNNLSLATRLYRNEFSRNWGKLAGFGNQSISIRDVLLNPDGLNRHYFDVLQGRDDSLDLDDQIVIGHNNRSFLSQGVQWDGVWEHRFDDSMAYELSFGLRLHEDWIRRDHSEEFKSILFGELIDSGRPEIATTRNKDQSTALATYLQNKLKFSQWDFIVGLRQELVKTKRTDRSLQKITEENDDRILIPGIGVVYRLGSDWTLFSGVHRGFTLVGPGQTNDIKPELSTNYEAGFRYRQAARHFEIIGFLNDYENIKGVCSFSAGCDQRNLDKEYDGGRAKILGAEASYFERWTILPRSAIDLLLNFTYTDAKFAEETTSENEEWGIGKIEKGDPLPYIAPLNLSATISYQWNDWSVDILGKWLSKMYDQSVEQDRLEIPSHRVFDLSIRYFPHSSWEVYGKVDNLLDEDYLVSLRPYGARPGKPRTFLVGMKWRS